MYKFVNFVVYLGYPGWGWKMYGLGWKTKWFIGLSINISKPSLPNSQKI